MSDGPTITEVVINFLRVNPGSTKIQIEAATKLSKHTVAPLLSKLASKGLVKRVKAPRLHIGDNMRVWHYSLPKKGS